MSGLSFDHAVPIEPLTVERIELLRGPATLLYGGQTSGVVNLISNRIPREALFDARGGVAGKADLGYATGSRERSGAALVETGTDRYALHVDAFGRKSERRACPGRPRMRARRHAGDASPHLQLGERDLWRRGRREQRAARPWLPGRVGRHLPQHLRHRRGRQRRHPDAAKPLCARRRMALRRLASSSASRCSPATPTTPTPSSMRSDPTTRSPSAPTICGSRHAARRSKHGVGALSGLYGVQAGNMRFSALGEEAFVPAIADRRSSALFGLKSWLRPGARSR